MTKYFINGKLVYTDVTGGEPYGFLREMLIDAEILGHKVEIVRE